MPRLWITILCGLILNTSLVHAETLLIDPDQVFTSAAEAYEKGDYDQSAALYEQLLAAGYDDVAVTFNLGNVYFRSSDVGRAVLNYRKAWYKAPRDADILTNLKHVQNKAKLVSPETGPLDRMFQTLGPGEWAACLLIALWVGGLCFLGSLYKTHRKVGMRRATLSFVLIALVAGSGMLHWRNFNRRQEAVVILDKQQVKYGPLAAAKAHFDVPPGSIVRIMERSEEWLRVTLNEKSGWIEESACALVNQ